MVLLKNDQARCRCRNVKTLAVIGPNAASLIALEGNYNGTPSHPVLPLDGIEHEFANAKVLYAQGSPYVEGLSLPVPRTASAGEGRVLRQCNIYWRAGADARGTRQSTSTGMLRRRLRECRRRPSACAGRARWRRLLRATTRSAWTLAIAIHARTARPMRSPSTAKWLRSTIRASRRNRATTPAQTSRCTSPTRSRMRFAARVHASVADLWRGHFAAMEAAGRAAARRGCGCGEAGGCGDRIRGTYVAAWRAKRCRSMCRDLPAAIAQTLICPRRRRNC